MRRLLVLLAAFALSACVSLPNPIGTSVGFKNDPALEGLWLGKSRNDDSFAYYHVLLNADDTMTVVGVSTRRVEDKGGWAVLSLTTVTLGANHYVNVRERFEDGKPKDDNEPVSAYYSKDGDTLTVYAFDPGKVAADIRAGRIAGKIEKGRFDDTVTITAGVAQVDRWLSSPGAPRLFAPVLTLHRIHEPDFAH